MTGLGSLYKLALAVCLVGCGHPVKPDAPQIQVFTETIIDAPASTALNTELAPRATVWVFTIIRDKENWARTYLTNRPCRT